MLGLKQENCAVGNERISTATGTRIARADTLTLGIAKGRPGAILAPPTKVSSGTTEEVAPLKLTVALRSAGPRRLTATMTVVNLTDCPVAVSIGRVTAALSRSAPLVFAVSFGGRDRVVLQSGARAVGHADLPVERDGSWRIDGSAYADVGAAS